MKNARKILAAAILVLFEVQAYAQSKPPVEPPCKVHEANEQRKVDAIAALRPAMNPYSALSRLSCIDQILNTRISIGLSINIDSLLSGLISRAINRFCARVNESWGDVLRRVRTDYTINIDRVTNWNVADSPWNPPSPGPLSPTTPAGPGRPIQPGGPATGSFPVVGFATRLIPPPPEQTVAVNGRIDLRPGNAGGPTLLRHANCGTLESYEVAVPSDIQPGNWTSLLMRGGQSISYRFTPRNHIYENGVGKWQFSPRESYGPFARTFTTISESPCDWDYAKRASGNLCYAIDNYGYYLVNGIANIDEFRRRNGGIRACVLDPDKTYFLNVRWEDPINRPRVDDCSASFPQNQYCASTVSP